MLDTLTHKYTRSDLAIIRRAQKTQADEMTRNHQDTISRLDTVQATVNKQQHLVQGHHATALARLDDIRHNQDSLSSKMIAMAQETDNHIVYGVEDIAQKIATLQLTSMNDDQILIEGHDLSAGIDALQHMNKRLAQALRTVASSQEGLVLPREITDQVTGEVDKLLKYSYRRAGTGNGGFSEHGLDFSLTRRIHTIPCRTSNHLGDADGFMTIELAEGQDVLGRRVRRIRFASFSVRPSGHGSAVIALVSQAEGVREQISRQIRVLNIRPRTDDVFDFAKRNDVQGLRRLFVDGRASVFDYDGAGFSLLHVGRRNVGTCV